MTSTARGTVVIEEGLLIAAVAEIRLHANAFVITCAPVALTSAQQIERLRHQCTYAVYGDDATLVYIGVTDTFNPEADMVPGDSMDLTIVTEAPERRTNEWLDQFQARRA